jgi:phosphosulfolactate phosphohydrolase-like enzyme
MDHRFVGIPQMAGVPRVAVVVNVMQAFTVAAWVFSRGAEKIFWPRSMLRHREFRCGRRDCAVPEDRWFRAGDVRCHGRRRPGR